MNDGADLYLEIINAMAFRHTGIIWDLTKKEGREEAQPELLKEVKGCTKEVICISKYYKEGMGLDTPWSNNFLRRNNYCLKYPYAQTHISSIYTILSLWVPKLSGKIKAALDTYHCKLH